MVLDAKKVVDIWVKAAKDGIPHAQFPGRYNSVTGEKITMGKFLELTRDSSDDDIVADYEIGMGSLHEFYTEQIRAACSPEAVTNNAKAMLLRTMAKELAGYERKIRREDEVKVVEEEIKDGDVFQLRIDLNGEVVGWMGRLGIIEWVGIGRAPKMVKDIMERQLADKRAMEFQTNG